MKNLIPLGLLSFTLFCAFIPSGFSDEPIEGLLRSQMEFMVREQYAVTQRALQTELSQAQQHIKALQAERAAAIERASSRAKLQSTGMELLKKYDALISARYVDKKGEFVSGLEIAQTDIDNLNDLLKAHLSIVPLSGRVSAGQSRKVISWAVDRLSDQASDNRSPSESNNSELEILGTMQRAEEARSKRALNLAESLGLRLDPKLSHKPEAP